MQLPSIIQGEAPKRLLQGAALGAVATVVIGFGSGGWLLESSAAQRANSAVVAVLAPICADRFQNATDASVNLANFKKESYYNRTKFIQEGGWAILPGNDEANAGVARACATILNGLE